MSNRRDLQFQLERELSDRREAADKAAKEARTKTTETYHQGRSSAFSEAYWLLREKIEQAKELE
jgi:hypothetical protein